MIRLDLAGLPCWVPLIIREWRGEPFGYSPYGYPGFIRPPNVHFEARDLITALSRQLAQSGVVGSFIRLHPLQDADVEEYVGDRGAVISHGPTAAFDLREGLDAAWGTIRPRLRTDVRRLERDGYRVSTDWNRIEDFKSTYRATMHRVAADSYYYFSEDYWKTLLGFPPDWVKLISVLDAEDEYAAGGVFTSYGRMAQYHLGATEDSHMSANPTKLMFWAAARLAYEDGCDYLHLGGGLGARRDGLYQLKSGFGRFEAEFRTLRVVATGDSSAHLFEAGNFGLEGGRFPPE